MKSLLRLWFALEGRVARGTYLRHGAALVAAKLVTDAALVWIFARRLWTPLDYLSPFVSDRDRALQPSPEALLFVLAFWALPFLWIGVAMTLRRLTDAGKSPWLCVLFFVPVVNWALMLALCALPAAPQASSSYAELRERRRLQSALLGVAAGVAIGAVSFGLSVVLFKSYNGAVFLGTPFTMGGAAGFLFNRNTTAPDTGTTRLGALTVGIAALATLVFALEGALFMAMTLPIAMPIGMLGSHIGAAIAIEHRATSPRALLLVLLLPLSSAVEARLKPPLREVTTAVEIAAPPEKVWPHVLGFSDLEAPPDWLFRLGIAYPVRARLTGTGVGAIRRCEFSTGPFIEPITAWEAPSRLAFDVASQPPPMHEWSPYRHVHPPHLEGTMRSRRGEFRLVRLAGGRTRLEGSTFYELAMAPQGYWAIWSDLLVHKIHQRVLEQIRKESEAG
jgi:uncharacterized membrane protein YhaH (DUF805 family)